MSMVDIIKSNENISVVVIDDSQSSRERISHILKESGYRILLFSSADEGIGYCERDGADLVILDDIMPDCNGFRALSILKDNVRTRAIPVIFISSLREISERAKAIELGADDCIIRPVSGLELKVRAKNLIGLKALRTEIMHRERLVSIGRLAGGVAHEINNPLTGVIASLQMLERQIPKFYDSLFSELERTGVSGESLEELKNKLSEKGSPGEKIEKYVKLALKGGKRCSKVVGDLLEYSAPAKEEKIVAVRVNELVTKSLNLLKGSLHDEHVELHVEIPEDIPDVKGTWWELQQVLVSLLNNAVQAVKESEQKKVEVKGYVDKGMVMIEITDTGRGIPEKNLSAIFDLFYTTKAEGEGMGLGLSAVNQILMKYGGKISVSSTEEKGSTFRVHLEALY